MVRPPHLPPCDHGLWRGTDVPGGHQRLHLYRHWGQPSRGRRHLHLWGQGQEVSGTSRTITVTADRSNHGSTCTCRARWKTYNPCWYTQTADVTLTVFCEYACVTVSSCAVHIVRSKESEGVEYIDECKSTDNTTISLLTIILQSSIVSTTVTSFSSPTPARDYAESSMAETGGKADRLSMTEVC